ncbi:hypothetical protein HYH02_001167 [Chlamydomonas schloesseri]|uniref:Protein kinase domain-containing protein n=1 Tax=Chlamydomonas schloesseri TaxID=2026947 RepID=A0A836BC66_9CHLO|nr:hypothetical protein HYH02_001167 [Chlamydomonas schloesseri]|eukprot:KAG2454131.1 hypothetical protein HYH02_001167 [Chlamydomonas schloesseri]
MVDGGFRRNAEGDSPRLRAARFLGARRSLPFTVALVAALLTHTSVTNGSQVPPAAVIGSSETFINAVIDCASRRASLANAELFLADNAVLQAFWSGLLGTDPSLQEAVPSVGGLWTWDESRLCRAALLTQQPGRAVGSSPAEPPGLVRFEGRPCAARLPYVCVPDAQVQAAGLTSSSLDWFRTHVRNASTAVRDAGATAASTAAAVTGAATALVVGSSSPHLLGPERSGLVLLRSGFALGGTRVPLGLRAEEWGPGLMNNSKPLYSQLRTSAFDDSELFWSRGPIVTAFFRSHNGRLLALRPVREKEAAVASRDVAAVGNRSTGAGYGSGLLSDGVFGASRPDLDGLSSAPYETHHVGPYQDYVVSVQGCFRTLAVEVLLLVTRSGRRYRLGRGSCSVWFREDAPPGGFLAGFAGLHIDVAHWSSQPPLPFFEGQVPNLPWLMQLELLWAAPAGSPPPVYTQRLPALLRHTATLIAPPSSACPGAYALASLNHELMHSCSWPWIEIWPNYYFTPSAAAGCPSNMCCNKPLFLPDQAIYVPYNYSQPFCATYMTACTRSCQVQAGLCAVVPDRPALQFAVTSSSPSAAPTAADTAATSAAAMLAPGSAVLQQQQQPRLYIMYPDTHVSYEAAADMCRGITHLGLAWRLVAAREVLTWTAAVDIRNLAYGALMDAGYFWLDDSRGAGGGSSNSNNNNITTATRSGMSMCPAALFGQPGVATGAGSGAEYDTITYDSSAPCDGVGAVVCTLTAPREPPAAGGSGGAAGSTSTSSSLLVPPASRHTSRAWSAGRHRLTQSRRVASGNFGNFTCSATLLEAATSNLPNVSSGNAGSAAQLPALAGRPTVVLTAPPRAFLISTALQVSEAGNSVSAVSGLGMELAGVAPADSGAAAAAGTDPAAATELTAGNPSTRGWHRLELLPEEVVVAASGCAGGHLELLLLHTSLGRVLAPPLTAGPEGAAGGSAACTSSFAETAPAGAYLVGFQVTFGHFIESMRLLWGQPLLVPSPGTAAADGTGGSDYGNGAASTAGSEGRGGALSSAVVVGSGSGGAADTHTAGPSQEGPQSAAPGDQPSSVPRLDVVAGPASNSSVGGGGGDRSSVSPAVIGGAVAAAAALVLAAAAGTALFMRQRRQRRRQQQQQQQQRQQQHQQQQLVPQLVPAAAGKLLAGVLAPSGGGGSTSPGGTFSSSSGGRHAERAVIDSSLAGAVDNAVGVSCVNEPQAHESPLSPRRPFGGVAVTAAAQQPPAASCDACEGAPTVALLLVTEAAEGTALVAAEGGGSGGPARRHSQQLKPASASSATSHAADNTATKESSSEGSMSPRRRWTQSATCPDAHSPTAAIRHAAAVVREPPTEPAASSSHGPERPAPSNQDDFRDRLCISSCRGGSSTGGDWFSVSDADVDVPTAAGAGGASRQQEQPDHNGRRQLKPGAAHKGAEPVGSTAATAATTAAAGAAAAATPGAAGSMRQVIEEALDMAQAELAARQPVADGNQRHARRPDLVLTSVLGSGSFGVVFHGTWRGLRVAVKTLVVHDSLMGAERHRAILEAAISKSLNHLNVVTTYETKVIPLSVPAAARQQQQQQQRAALQPEAGGPGLLGASAAGEGSSAAAAGATSVSPGDNAAPGVLDATTDTYKLLLVMEYCDAGSLACALDDHVVGSVAAGGLAALCALTLALDVACGMRHIHSRNIIHGDLSAGNILLSSATARCHGGDPADADVRSPLAELWMPPLVAKVADFGLSVHMGEHQTHASNRYQGTPAYTAPEVLSRGRLSAASDVWSFGCILLELTHGERIHVIRERAMGAATGAAAAGRAAVGLWAALPPLIPPRLAQLLAGCLSMDPGARPSFSQVAEALAEILTA